MPHFQMATNPYKHQVEVFEESRGKKAFGVLWEQGTGKTKLAIDTLAWLYSYGHVDALLVVAPNGVHNNWLSDELPRHLHESVPFTGMSYQSAKAQSVKSKSQFERTVNSKDLAVLAMSYDAFITDYGKATAKRFLLQRKCLYTLDESQRIKNPSAIRTKTILASAKYAPFRRILTGTPIAQGPFDIYTQMKFLDEHFWLPHGFSSFAVFKQYFGVFQQMRNPTTSALFDCCVGYRNLPVLARIIKEASSRVLKSEVLDLPPKVYTKRYFEMETTQAQLYEQMRQDFLVLLQNGHEVTAALAIVRLTRLQQITCGYVPCETENGDIEMLPLGKTNPRLACLLDVLEDVPHQAIIFARYRHDIDLITEKLGNTCVRYDGKVSADNREIAIQQFKAGEAKWIVANPAAMSEGRTLTEAKTIVYYNNSFKLTERLQSEDRAHRIGQDQSVSYIDIVCAGTIDEHITESLVTKNEIACQLTGDAIRKWL